MYGALLAGEVHVAELRCKQLPVLITGQQALAKVWKKLLAEHGIAASWWYKKRANSVISEACCG